MTEYASTPYTPIAATRSATTANAPSKIAFSLGCAALVETQSSIVLTVEIGTSRSSSRTFSRALTSTAVDPQKDPSVAFDKLFGSQVSSTPSPMVSADDQLRSAMLDLTTAELNDLKTSVSSLTTESTKLQTHLDAIAALKQGGSMSGSGKSSCGMTQKIASIETVRSEGSKVVIDSSHSNV